MDDGGYREVRDLLAKAGLGRAEAARIFGVSETTVAGWSRSTNRPAPKNVLILLRAAGAGLPLPLRRPIYRRLVERGAQLAAAGDRPANPEDIVANQLREQQAVTVACTLDEPVLAALEFLAVQPWRWRRQFLAAARLSAPVMAIEWDGRGPFGGQRILAVATQGKGEAFSLRLIVEDLVRQRPVATMPQRAEINPEGLRSLPAEDVAAEAAALLACGLPHDVVGKPVWWLVQLTLMALAQGDLG